jgi:hypothetical protein
MLATRNSTNTTTTTSSSSSSVSVVVGSNSGVRVSIKSRAVASAVDAYATRLLKCRSCPSAGVDPSLGPYVTNWLRRRRSSVSKEMVELLEEHCNMSAEMALQTLELLQDAVETGVVPVQTKPYRRHRSVSMGNEHDYYGHMDAIRLLGGMLADSGIGYDNPPKVKAIPEHDTETNNTTPTKDNDNNSIITTTPQQQQQPHRTPLKPDRLIPVDLLGEIDDPYDPPTPKPKEEKPMDLAACLFRPSRPRANSVACIPEPQKLVASPVPQGNQAQMESTVSLLLTMNYGLSEEAAQEAAWVSQADVNLAQHFLDQAWNAPPVCRHMLNHACYRSDCQFSHDVEGHTCLFWLRGKCGKPNCKFLHGFAKSNIPDNYTICKPIPTTNLVEHNQNHTRPTPTLSSSPLFLSSSLDAFTPKNADTNHANNFANYFHHQDTDTITTSSSSTSSSLSSSFPTIKDAPDTTTTTNNNNSHNNKPTFSFAKIATKGYHQSKSFHDTTTTNNSNNSSSNYNNLSCSVKKVSKMTKSPKVVKVPQDLLWNVGKRKDVIDLKGQSNSTFAAFLATVLPEKLNSHSQVWLWLPRHLNNSCVLTWLQSKHFDVRLGNTPHALCILRPPTTTSTTTTSSPR